MLQPFFELFQGRMSPYYSMQYKQHKSKCSIIVPICCRETNKVMQQQQEQNLIQLMCMKSSLHDPPKPETCHPDATRDVAQDLQLLL